METANRRIREGKVGGGTFSVLQGVTPEEQAKRDAVVAGIERQIPSSPALSQARQAAAGRGDFEAVDRSFLNPEERAERRLVRSLAGSSRRDAPAALEAVGRLQGQRTEAAFGQQKLESGALALGQQKRLASMLNQLGELDPKDEQGRATLIENILAFQPGKSKQPPTPSYRSVEIPTGQIDPITGNPITRAALYDSTTGQVGPPLTVPPAPGGAGAEAYGSREEIRAAYQAGQLTREQAKALLQK